MVHFFSLNRTFIFPLTHFCNYITTYIFKDPINHTPLSHLNLLIPFIGPSSALTHNGTKKMKRFFVYIFNRELCSSFLHKNATTKTPQKPNRCCFFLYFFSTNQGLSKQSLYSCSTCTQGMRLFCYLFSVLTRHSFKP